MCSLAKEKSLGCWPVEMPATRLDIREIQQQVFALVATWRSQSSGIALSYCPIFPISFLTRENSNMQCIAASSPRVVLILPWQGPHLVRRRRWFSCGRAPTCYRNGVDSHVVGPTPGIEASVSISCEELTSTMDYHPLIPTSADMYCSFPSPWVQEPSPGEEAA